jgi:hypothetical protein
MNNFVRADPGVGPYLEIVVKRFLGKGGAHGLEARATGIAYPYPLSQALSPNPLPYDEKNRGISLDFPKG